MTIVRTRLTGNFLFTIFIKSDIEIQVKLQNALQRRGLWRNFYDFQTIETKLKKFDAEIIGICTQILITDPKIIKIVSKTDLEKLYLFWEELVGKE